MQWGWDLGLATSAFSSWPPGTLAMPRTFPHTPTQLLTRRLSPQMNGARCSHHSECYSDCCLMNLDYGGTFCAPKARRAMVCLPQVRLWGGATPSGKWGGKS